MADIFISYKHEEQQIAKKLADALQKKGWTVWWDPEVLTGERFHDIIDTELKESKCVVVLWSKLSVESENVKDEATYALKRKKLVPITIEDVDLPYWAERINTGQLINWDGSDNFPGYQKLVSDITKIIAEEDKRRRKEAERKAENERRRRQEQERKFREEEQRKAAEERQRLEEEKQRLAEQKQKFEEEQKRKESARKAEEERKQEQDRKRKADDEKRLKNKEELKRKAEEEHKRTEAEAERKAEEERNKKEIEAKHREGKAKIKPGKTEPVKINPPEPKPDIKAPTEPKSPEPRKTSNVLKFSVLAGVAVLLIAGIWWWVHQQQVKEVRQELEKLDRQALKLEKEVADVDNQVQLKELSNQRDILSDQVEGFSEQASKAGMGSHLEQIRIRLKQIQIQKKEISIKIERFYEQIEEIERSVVKVDNQEQLKGLFEQRDILSHQVEGFVEKANKVGLESQLEQLRDRLKKIQIQLAIIEKELFAARQGRIFVESVPDNATVKILNIDHHFEQGMVLEPGKYHFLASSEGYEPQDRWIELGSGEEKRINFELKKIPPKVARLHVETGPEYAMVRILNIKQKFVQDMELEPGSYHVEVAAEGYETEKRWIKLVAGHEESFRFKLAKIETQEPPSPQKVITNRIGMKFVLIQSGSFIMGSPPNEPERDTDERQHEVYITKPFYLQTTEVSQGQWKEVIGDTMLIDELEDTRDLTKWWKKEMGEIMYNPSRFRDCGNNCPVEGISWNDAQKFIKKLNQMEGINKYRLPTEAEWEYSCRAGTTTPFFTGECISTDQANYNGNLPAKNCPKGEYREKTVKVGSFQPNAWGLYDMHGNVWEWCQDWYGDYPSNSVPDPKGSDKGKYRVLRGGSWNDNAMYLRSTDRNRLNPGLRGEHFGFRVARDF